MEFPVWAHGEDTFYKRRSLELPCLNRAGGHALTPRNLSERGDQALFPNLLFATGRSAA